MKPSLPRWLTERALALLAGAWAAAGPALAQDAETLPRADGEPVRVVAYAPAQGPCRGVVVLSPGAGGSEQGLARLGEGLAALGRLAVVVGHRESGLPVLRERSREAGGLEAGLAALIADPAAYRARFMDIAAARAWATTRCSGAPAVLLGHSMGAATVMIEAGARNRLGLSGGNGFSAYIALSPQGPGSIFPTKAWGDIRGPVLSITGTRDRQLGGEGWEHRTLPHADMAPGCKWLAVLDGATHMNLGGVGLAGRTQAALLTLVAAFLDGVQRGDCAAPPAPPGVTLQVK